MYVQIVARRVPAPPPPVLPTLCVPEKPEVHKSRLKLNAGEELLIKGHHALLARPRILELRIEVSEEVVVVDGEGGGADASEAVAEEEEVLECV